MVTDAKREEKSARSMERYRQMDPYLWTNIPEFHTSVRSLYLQIQIFEVMRIYGLVGFQKLLLRPLELMGADT